MDKKLERLADSSVNTILGAAVITGLLLEVLEPIIRRPRQALYLLLFAAMALLFHTAFHVASYSLHDSRLIILVAVLLLAAGVCLAANDMGIHSTD